MKKATVHIPFEEEKLAAVRLYMEQKELSFEERDDWCGGSLVRKACPRQCTGIYRDARGLPKTSAKTNPCRPSSVVDAAPDGDLD